MPMHRGVVIRAEHSGFRSAAGLKRIPPPVYRAVLADKVFKGSLESVMQQIDAALGSKPTAYVPVRLPPPAAKKAAKKSPAEKSAKRKTARPAKKKAGRR